MSEKSYRLFVRYPLVFAIGSLVFMGIFAKRGLLDYRRMVEKNQELQGRIGETDRQAKSLALQMEGLKSSSDEQERLIRSVLGFVHKNDVIIEFD